VKVEKINHSLKKAYRALWNGKWGARMIPVPNSAPAQVLSFVRQKEGDKILAVLNLSAKIQNVTLYETLYHGLYHEVFSGEAVELSGSTLLKLEPWGYRVYVSRD
jgi:hypothetical protein